MASIKPITLYDFDGTASPQRAWNSNTWKARFALNIKAIPYKTEWVNYGEVESVTKAVGAKPNGKRFLDGSDLYTLPAIFDPNTDTCIVDSEKIAEYLEEKYPDPDKPAFFPPGTKELQQEFRDLFGQSVRGSIIRTILHPIALQLPESSRAHFVPPREAIFGGKLDELAPFGSDKYKAYVDATLKGLSASSAWIDAHRNEGTKGPFVFGEQPSFADLDAAATLIWTKITAGEGEGSIWTAIAQTEGGRWKRYLDEFEKWSAVP